MKATLFRHLRSGKAVYDLAKELFYGLNTFRIGCDRDSVDDVSRTLHPSYFLHPQPPMAAFPRKIQYFMGLTNTEWMTLNDIAEKKYGFGGLTQVDIVVHLDLDRLDDYESHTGIFRGPTWSEKAQELAKKHHFQLRRKHARAFTRRVVHGCCDS